jgi:cob(I)alamin adenosyltransferase
MSPAYTRSGDDGTTGFLGEGRLPKFDLRIETLGAIDEASAAVGLARSLTKSSETNHFLIKIQRELYAAMAEAASALENADHFRGIGLDHVEGLEAEIARLEVQVKTPGEFILPGDSPAGAALSLARTVIRRRDTESRFTGLFQPPLHLIIYAGA